MTVVVVVVMVVVVANSTSEGSYDRDSLFDINKQQVENKMKIKI